MSQATSAAARERADAARLPEGDVIRILLEQHASIHELFGTIKQAQTGEHRKDAFKDLRALLAMHETAEEMILRPVSRKAAPEDVAEARNKEEAEANEVLAHLETLDPAAPEFLSELEKFERSVDKHATAEESEEFGEVIKSVEEKDRLRMGKAVVAAQKVAPTHPHPSAAGSTTAQWAAGPFASILDRARDAVSKGMHESEG